MNKNLTEVIKKCSNWWANEAIKKIMLDTNVSHSSVYYDFIRGSIIIEISNYLEAKICVSDEPVILETDDSPKGVLKTIQKNFKFHNDIFPHNTITSILNGNLIIIKNYKGVE